MITKVLNKNALASTITSTIIIQKNPTRDLAYQSLRIKKAAIKTRLANSLILRHKNGKIAKQIAFINGKKDRVILFDETGKEISRTHHKYSYGRHNYTTTKSDGTVIEFFG